jgi:hypothetical protein
MNVVLSYNTSLSAVSNFQGISNGEIIQYNNFPILAFNCQEKDLNFIQNLEGVIFIHEPKNFRIYNKILEQLDKLCSLSEQKRQAISVINISISPGSYPFEATEPMNIAMRIASEKGFNIVVAVGNSGPKQNTLNPWSVAPWVIGVGASDQSGKELWERSSIGIPDHPFYHPTVVTHGKDVPVLVPQTVDLEKDKTHGTKVVSIALAVVKGDGEGLDSGTSLAAPSVSRICLYIIKFIDILDTTNRLLKKISQTGVIDLNDAMILSTMEPLPKLFYELNQHNLDYTVTSSPSLVKQFITSMAKPMPEYSLHQVGAGFVSDDIAKAYLSKFSTRDFISFFCHDTIDISSLQLENSLNPILPIEVIENMMKEVREQSNALDCPVA